MLNPKIENALNDQIHHELSNAYAYLSAAAWFTERNLPGFAHWMRIQHDEERDHAMRLFDFVLDRGGKISLGSIETPAQAYNTPKEVFAAVLQTEQATTAKLNRLYMLAVEEKDPATQSHLKWYVDEQVEEEKNATAMLATLEMAGDGKGTLLMLDHQAGKRVKG